MLEVTKQPKEEIKYPVARRDPDYGFIVLFFSEKHGVVIDRGLTILVKQGETSSIWSSCNNSERWEPIDITITG
ncbi:MULTISPECIES: hypothetical protein [unclassified Snodgrassella]|uniref:hypothetical protein n=1 Tax=unclassified Snodgrassella TaxID=2625236 RepID=UPI0018DB27DA|nr:MULTISPECIES: hypothetical protein [unclassified Snodgrassella]MBI0068821.1 hypothetical protein [Snodgrassella sp. M0110]MBI0077442.1 hypothetical protein [Snodgrassella sp. M0118]MBI0079755.1 hypothetical protein [Snodgrassella sp. M0112]